MQKIEKEIGKTIKFDHIKKNNDILQKDEGKDC